MCTLFNNEFCANGIRYSLGFVDEGFRFGQLGLQIFHRFNIQQWMGRVYSMYYGLLHALKFPLTESIDPLTCAYHVSLEKGDIEFGFLCLTVILTIRIEFEPLDKMNTDLHAHIKQMAKFGHFHNLEALRSLHLLVKNFLGRAHVDVSNSTEEFCNEEEYDDVKSPSNMVVGWTHVHRLWLYYMFGRFDRSFFHAQAVVSKGMLTKGGASTSRPFILLVVGLADIAYARSLGIQRLTYARKCIRMIRKFAHHAPSNFLGKQYLLEAELASFQNKHNQALQGFVCAIALAKDAGMIIDAALGYELAAKALSRASRPQRADLFFDDAVLMYRKWGSVPKATHLLCEVKEIKKCRGIS
jgi:hypothetical protein